MFEYDLADKRKRENEMKNISRLSEIIVIWVIPVMAVIILTVSAALIVTHQRGVQTQPHNIDLSAYEASHFHSVHYTDVTVYTGNGNEQTSFCAVGAN